MAISTIPITNHESFEYLSIALSMPCTFLKDASRGGERQVFGVTTPFQGRYNCVTRDVTELNELKIN